MYSDKICVANNINDTISFITLTSVSLCPELEDRSRGGRGGGGQEVQTTNYTCVSFFDIVLSGIFNSFHWQKQLNGINFAMQQLVIIKLV